MAAFEDILRRRTVVSDTLQQLTGLVPELRIKIDRLEAGLHVERLEALAELERLLDACQNLRFAILSEDSAAAWTTREELHALVARLDDTAGKRRRFLDLAELLGGGTVSHRRERTRQERLRQRDAAVAELLELSALPEAPELPGPEIGRWLEWACSLNDSSNDPALELLRDSFPRLDEFVGQLELDQWTSGAVTGDGEGETGEPPAIGIEEAAQVPELDGHDQVHGQDLEQEQEQAGPAVEVAVAVELGSAVEDLNGVQDGSEDGGEDGEESNILSSAAAPHEEAVQEEAHAPRESLEGPEPVTGEIILEGVETVETVDGEEAPFFRTSTTYSSARTIEDALAFGMLPVETLEPELAEQEEPILTDSGKLCLFPAHEVAHFARAVSDPEMQMGRRVQALLAVSHWLTPQDQNPLLHPACGMRALIGYTGSSDLLPVSAEEAAGVIDNEHGVLLLTGGADLLRWARSRRGDDRIEAVASIRRLTLKQIKAWFKDLYRIELAEPQVQDMYDLTSGVPLLLGELHRLVIPDPKMPPTWLGFMIWTTVKMNFERRLPVVARELRNGPAGVRLTEREIRILKMVAIASDNSTPQTIASNLEENWEQYERPELEPLNAADVDSVGLLQGLGLLPMKRIQGLSPIQALVPLGPQDTLRQLVSYL